MIMVITMIMIGNSSIKQCSWLSPCRPEFASICDDDGNCENDGDDGDEDR